MTCVSGVQASTAEPTSTPIALYAQVCPAYAGSGEHSGKNLILIAPAREEGIRKIHALAARAGLFKRDQLIGLFDREHPEQDGIHQAEDRRVRPDPKRQRQHRYYREARTFQQLTKSVAQILPQCIHPASSSYFVGQIADPADIAETLERHGPRFFRPHPTLDVRLGLHLDVDAQLFFSALQDAVAPKVLDGLRQFAPVGPDNSATVVGAGQAWVEFDGAVKINDGSFTVSDAPPGEAPVVESGEETRVAGNGAIEIRDRLTIVALISTHISAVVMGLGISRIDV